MIEKAVLDLRSAYVGVCVCVCVCVCACVCVHVCVCVVKRPECEERKGRSAPRRNPREGGRRGGRGGRGGREADSLSLSDREAQHQGDRPSAAQYPDGTPPHGSASQPQRFRQKPLTGIPRLSCLSPSASATCHELRI
jgi:hypothetical protein